MSCVSVLYRYLWKSNHVYQHHQTAIVGKCGEIKDRNIINGHYCISKGPDNTACSAKRIVITCPISRIDMVLYYKTMSGGGSRKNRFKSTPTTAHFHPPPKGNEKTSAAGAHTFSTAYDMFKDNPNSSARQVGIQLVDRYPNEPIPNQYQLANIKKNRHVARTLNHDDVMLLQTYFTIDKQFLCALSLTLDRQPGFYCFSMLPNMKDYVLQYGKNNFYIDGVAILPQYGFQMVTIHVKVNNKPITVAYAVVSRYQQFFTIL